MTKTIEEAARESAEAAYDGGEFQTDSERDQGVKDLTEAFMLFYKKDIMSLPIAQRLTAKEKEMMRNEYAKTIDTA